MLLRYCRFRRRRVWVPEVGAKDLNVRARYVAYAQTYGVPEEGFETQVLRDAHSITVSVVASELGKAVKAV